MRRTRPPRIDKFKFYDVVIYAARGSHSARRLAKALGCRRWRDDLPTRYTRRRPYFRGNSSPMVINWGSTVPATWLHDPRFRLSPRWYNSAESVGRAIDKRSFFNALDGRVEVPTLKFSTDAAVAGEWLKKGHGVVARRNPSGSGGTDIVVIQPGKELIKAPLYTRYFPKTHEFRAHVWGGRLIDFTQKKLKGGPDETANRSVRSLANGWVHAHGDLAVAQPDIEQMGQGAIACIAALGLHFGAVDILAVLVGGRLKSYKICEVNTGPGLENTQTIQAYANAILAEKRA